MKLIKKAQPVKINLNEKFTVGQKIKLNKGYHDGRGGYETWQLTYSVEKVNRVTIDVADKCGNTYRFNPLWEDRTLGIWVGAHALRTKLGL
jgi:hypothetical protein